ncbi:MAG: HAD-IIB family hydrolase [Candidatus Micrarchaeota archaeon]|nr:HAD-IIB family hydrolase [Candidatus Micrarchaeota archaeon]
MQTIVFTDLDGAMLDEGYSYDAVKESVAKLKERKIPIVICTSKTRAEIEIYTNELGIGDPFISENGGAIFIPKGYFDFDFDFTKEDGRYCIIELGTPTEKLIEVLGKIKKYYRIKSFHDMTDEELSHDAALPLERAKKAKLREYDEAFKILDVGAEDVIKQVINEAKLQFVRGTRYWHIHGDNDKGKAVRILCNLFRRKYGDIKTIAIGESPNDFPMLDAVDRPYLVRRFDNAFTSEKYIKAWGIGPDGWVYAIKEEINL